MTLLWAHTYLPKLAYACIPVILNPFIVSLLRVILCISSLVYPSCFNALSSQSLRYPKKSSSSHCIRRFNEAIVQQHTLIRKSGTYMPSAICGTSVGIQIWLSLLSSFFQPSCVQTVKGSVKRMTEICSLLKLLIVQHLESTAD